MSHMLQVFHDELLKAGLSRKHADEFVAELRRSRFGDPRCGLSGFFEFCDILHINSAGVRLLILSCKAASV